jgi:rhamnulokinase
MSTPYEHVAIDLGAGSGRVFAGGLAAGGLLFTEVHRFHYAPRAVDGHLRWDAARLFSGIEEGLQRASAHVRDLGGRLRSVGVDSWGVDYGLIDRDGELVEEPVCYRDARTEGVMDAVFARVPRSEIFARTGIQFMALNTLYQLAAHASAGLPADAAKLLMIPDLCHLRLCGSLTGEHTNASTTQLLDARTRRWDDVLFERLALPRALMPELVETGTILGRVTDATCRRLGIEPLEVIAPATHDTGSAVAGTPLEPGWAFISSGTWSLVGIERTAPLLDAATAQANFTNEIGAFGTVRLLRNVTGLWLLDSCRREWQAAGAPQDLAALLDAVGTLRGFRGFVCPDAPRFFNPASMVSELRAALRETGQSAHEAPVDLAKVVLDSLAMRYASTIDTLERLTGQPVAGLHIVGGGSMNDYLNQATANATRKPVTAGPVEAAVCGNVLVQAIAVGRVGSIADGRRLLASGLPLRRYEPRDGDAWREAAVRYRDIEASSVPLA